MVDSVQKVKCRGTALWLVVTKVQVFMSFWRVPHVAFNCTEFFVTPGALFVTFILLWLWMTFSWMS